ncbi:PREDICTED: neuroblast differentiation-associated protein AHNAK isoform X10 [Lepidothrix coronata]|uniref:Neuroblast differentiation-associated protein AHNAK isoform X10 n=1 Tax=Lepidothrix coronata TaxID=321398 RepID=A0A6J0J9A6_9PASS|nr:PREDICTED: neuroblast differentiation-associated protein AHNAK isoform X10 [Lepidothrix coronata]
MEKEEETREILLPNWQGSGSHGITIDQTDDGVFVKRVQQNSPAARMGVVKEGDQIVSATVYFDNLQSGEVAQLLQTMGHHTVGLRLQRRGDRSPLPGQPWAHDVFAAGSPEVVLSGDDEEYRRIYTTKIKPRLKSEEGADAEGGGTQSRTITVTRKVTAYTVDVSRHGGAGDLSAAGTDLDIRVPSPGLALGADGEPGKIQLPTGELRTQPESQIPGGETGKVVLPEMPTGWKGSGAFPGSPRVETNGQMGELEVGFHIKGPRVDGKGQAPCLQGEVDGSPPPVDVGKIKIPALKIPKFGFQAGGGEAPVPPAGADTNITCSPVQVTGPGLSPPSATAGKVPSPQLGIPDVGIDGPGVELSTTPDADGTKGKVKIPHMTCPKFTALDSRGDGPALEIGVPKGEVAVEGGWKGPAFKKVETPQISLSDVNLSLKGPQAKGDLGGVTVPKVGGDLPGLGPKGLQVDVKAPEVEFGGRVKGPNVDVGAKGLKGEVDVSIPAVGGEFKGPQLELKGPAGKTPELHVQTPQISMPDVDLNLKGPGVKGNLDVSKLEGELKAPGLDIKGPRVDVGSPELDVQSPEGKLKFPKLKMPKFGVKGETPNVEVTLPKGEVDISGPKAEGPEVDVTLPTGNLDVSGPKVDIEGPEVDVELPEGKVKGPKFKMPEMHFKAPKISMPDVDFNLKGPKVKGDLDVSVPKLEGDLKAPDIDIKGPKVDVDLPDVELEGPEGKIKGPKFKMPEMNIKAPKISMPDIDLNLKGPKVKGDVDASLPKIEGELKGPKLDIKGPELEVEVPKVDLEGKAKKSRFKLPKFGFSGPKVQSPEVDVKLKKPEVEVSGPKVEVQAPDLDVQAKSKGSKFKMPFLNISSPKVSMPDVELNLKGHKMKGELDLSGPKLEGELKGPELDIKGPKVDVEAPDVDVHGPEGKIKMPKFKMPKFGLKGEGPEVDVNLPAGELDVSGPKVDIEGPEVDVELPEGKIKGPKFKMPEMNIKAPKISMPDIDLNLKGPKVKGDVDVSLPQVDLKGPKVDVEVPDLDVEGPKGKIKGPKFKMPEMNIKAPNLSMPDLDLSLKGPKLKGGVDVDLSAPKLEGDVNVPDIDIKGPKVDIEGPEVDIEGPEGKIKGPKFKMPEMHIKAPKISMPDVDFNLKGPKIKGDVDVSLPKLEGDLKGPELDIKGPKVDIDAPDVDIHGPEGKFKMPKFKMPKFGMPGVKAEGPEVDVTLPTGNLDVSGPKVDIEGPEVDVELPEGKVKGPKFKMPEMHFKTPKISMPDIDLNLKGPKVKGDVDVSLPKLEGDLKAPDIDLKGPKVDVDLPDVELEGPEGKLKGPKFKMPEMHIKAPKISMPDVDFNIKGPHMKGDIDVSAPRLEGDLQAPQIDVKGPKIDVEAPDVTLEGPEGKLKGPKFKMPEMNIKAPKFSMPDIDLNLKGPKVKGDMGVAAPALEGNLQCPDLDIKGPKLDIQAPEVTVEGPRIKMPEMHVKTPQISMPDIDLNLKGLKGKVDAEFHDPKLEGGLKGPEVDIKGPKVDIEGPAVDVDGLDGKVKLPKMKMPKFGFKGEGPDVDVNLPKAEVELSGPKVDLDVPEVSLEGPEGKVKGPKLKMPEMHVNVPKISMPEIDLSLKGHKTKGGFDLSAPKVEGHLKGPEVDLKGPEFGVKGPEVDVECPDLSVEGPEANVKLPKFKKSKFGFGMKSPKAEVDLPEAELSLESPDVNLSGKGKKSKFKMPKIHMSGPKVKGKKGAFDVNAAGAELDADLNVAGPDVTVKGDAAVKSPKGKKPMFGKISFPDVEFDLKSHRFRGEASAGVPKIEGELKAPDLEVSVPAVKGDVKGPSLSVDLEAPDVNLKSPKLKLPGGQVGVGDGKVGGDLKGPGVEVAVPSLPDFSLKGPKVKGEVGVSGAELEGPEGKLGWPKGGKAGLGLEMPDVNLDVSVPGVGGNGSLPSADVKLRGPQISGPEFEGNLKGPKLKGELDVSGSVEGPNVTLGTPSVDLGGLGGKMKLPKVPDLSTKGGVSCSVPKVEVGSQSPGANLAVSAPDLDVNLKGPKLKGDFGVKSPKTSADADADFEILGGTIKLPSLKLPQFGISGPGVEGGDAGVALEGPQVKGGLKGSALGLEGADVELKGPKFQVSSPGVSVPDVDLRLKGPNVDVSGDIKGAKVGVEAPRMELTKAGTGVHLDAPALEVSGSGLNVNMKGPKVKGGAEVGGGTFQLCGPKVGAAGPEGGQVKVSFPKLRMPKFVFSDPEAKGREVGVDVEFPGADVAVAAEPEPDDADGRLKKPKLKMPKFNFSKQKGRGGGGAPGSPEASGSVSGSRGDLKSSKASLGSAEGDAEAEAPSAKGKFSLFRSKKPRARSSSFSDDASAARGPEADPKAPKVKFGTFGGIGSKSKGCYEVTASDEEPGRAQVGVGATLGPPKSRLSSSSSSSEGGPRGPGVELTVAKRKE